MFRAVIRIPGGKDVPGIMEPDACRGFPRTSLRMEIDGEDTVAEITSADASAMRAALNSYLECVKIVEDILKLTK